LYAMFSHMLEIRKSYIEATFQCAPP
jgi:hypothetical protein